MELEAEPDADFVYSGFTGDCTPTGVSVMTQSRTCGATFDPVTTAPAAVTFTLTITKPTGGTVVGAGDILCGTLGSMCVAALPSGAPVTLRSQADAGYTFSQFTGDCAANGETTMTTARTCSATFTPTTSTLANNPGSEPRVAQPQRPQRGQEEIARVKQPQPQPPPPAPPAPLPPVGPQPPAPAPGGEQPPPPSPDGGKPAAAPITAEQHAKNEIDRVVKNYCTALETLKADRVKEWFPLQDLRALFKEYKSLKCTLTLPLEYERLDAAPAGVAQVKFEMKQVIQMRSGGAPKKLETIVWMTLSRLDLRSAWFIDRMRAEEKPPP